jgi:starch phosphorylase
MKSAVPVSGTGFLWEENKMKPIHTFSIIPSLPAPLESLRRLAYNLRWAWNHDTIELFRRLDSDLWERTHHNPVLMLGTIEQSKLETAAGDEGFLAHLERVSQEFDGYMAGESTWFGRSHGTGKGPLIAYFSSEFGITECLSIFAGGLGVLAGDHLKSASDLGVPLVGIGLLYQQGYFQQYLNEAGWQQEAYEDNDFHNLPLTMAQKPDGTHLTVDIPYPDRTVVAQVWQAQVGMVSLYLLDTNIPGNSPKDQRITYQLYGGDKEMRIKQEIMLGIGGYRALEALGLNPVVYHMNEGHSAFLALERVRRLVETHKISFAEAQEAASAGLVFTTHTPVEAGLDYFPPDLMDHYFRDYHQALGVSRKRFLALGRRDPNNDGEPFSMAILALRMAACSNGVSRLHGEVSREMWQGLGPGVPEDEVPIGHVTNGVHFLSWISLEMKQLYDRYLGPRWREEPADQTVWQRAKHISNEELWRTHERRRERLVAFARRRLRIQLKRRGGPHTEVELADNVLDSEALTIGFARRFATYKRATLLLRNPDRLASILNDPNRPVQIIFAGKAHPHDDAGKAFIQQIIGLARQDIFRRRIVFLEDYDMAVARYLLQGCDVWLNTPLRPQEASGTSGMKAAANGVLNLSILDGWWDEAYEPELGWAIGRGESYDDPHYQDQVEAEALYNLLERDVVPTFFDRDASGLPRLWIDRIKESIETLCHYFNTNRMVAEYTDRFYVSASERFHQLTGDKMTRAKALATWKTRIQKEWSRVRVEKVDAKLKKVQVGDEIHVQAWVCPGSLTPDDIKVELYLGRVDAGGEIVEAEATQMSFVKSTTKGRHLFEISGIPCCKSGLHGYTVRVLPQHPDLPDVFQPGLIVWA